MEAYLIATLGKKHAEHVPLVMERLREHCCSDVDTLRDCWEELKDEVPGVPRKMISDQMQKEELDNFKIKDHVDPKNWARGVLFGIVMVCSGAIIGGFQNADASLSNGGAAAGAFDDSVWFLWGWAWGPLFGLGALEVTAVWKLGPLFGWDMIHERSPSISMREAMRSNMTNVAVVGALLLTIVWAMLQSNPPIEGFPGRFISQWYAGLLVLSVAFLLIGVLTCVAVLLYVEPLDNKAALQCVADNFMYVGEPVAQTMMAMLNCIIATILWIFGTYGMGMGVLSVLIFFWACTRTAVNFLYLSQWHNPHLDSAEVNKRATMKVEKRVTMALTSMTAKVSSAP